MKNLMLVVAAAFTLGTGAMAAGFGPGHGHGHGHGGFVKRYACSARNLRGQTFTERSRDLYRAQSKALRACDSRSVLGCKLVGCLVTR